MARQPWEAGFPRAGPGKILPRPRRTSGVKQWGRRGHTHEGGAPAWTILQVLVALVLDVSCIWRERTTPPLGVHPLAVGRPPGSWLGLADGARMKPCLSHTLIVAAFALPGPSLSLRPPPEAFWLTVRSQPGAREDPAAFRVGSRASSPKGPTVPRNRGVSTTQVGPSASTGDLSRNPTFDIWHRKC
jgi:hypothetical protein